MHAETRIRCGLLLLCVAGCRIGPLTQPAIRRLEPDEQATVDRMWNNMLVTPDRLDRELLLDVLMTFELHEQGIDRATYHAEKDYAGGVVVMEMKYDRLKPLEDWFFVEIFDRQKKLLRKEHYTGDEIWSRSKDTFAYQLLAPAIAAAATQPSLMPVATTQPTTHPTDAELRTAWQIARARQILAATQPVKPEP